VQRAQRRPTQRWSYQPALDGLRALAVVAVFAYHLDASWIPGGFLGVDTFFVLSGFLITSLLLAEWGRSGKISLSDFWARRARRLLPALLLVLVAVAAYAEWSARSDTLDALRGDMLSTLFYGANWRFIASGQSYFDLFTEASPLRHAWSLAIEEQFYLVWPFVTLVCLRLARGRHWLLGAVCVVGTVASAFTMAQLYDPVDPSRAYYGTDTRAQLLLVGALLAIALARWSPERRRGALITTHGVGLLGAAFVVWSFAQVHDTDAWMYRGGYLVFAVAVAALIVSVVQSTSTPLRAVLSLAPVVWLGRISYGVYLWHWPVIVIASPDRTGLSGASLTLVRVGVTLAAATLSFYLVELPVRERRLLRGRRLAPALSPAAFVVTAVVVVLATRGGTPIPTYYRNEPVTVVGSAQADREPAPAAEAAAPAAAAEQPPRVLLVGDSIATSILPGLNEVATAAGIELSAAAYPGCGVIRGIPTLADASPIPGHGPQCDTEVPQLHTNMVNLVDPDLVIWFSGWEVTDRLVDGNHLQLGTPEGNAGYAALIAESATRLQAGGARLLFVLPAQSTEGGWLPHYAYSERVPRLAALSQLLREESVRRAGSSGVVDLAPVVCPGGLPCPDEVDGVVLRPDGTHFEKDGAVYVSQRLIPMLQWALDAFAAEAEDDATERAASARQAPSDRGRN
jgi:peptidoglycan/LPS O-acetylase OafA/YrhL